MYNGPSSSWTRARWAQQDHFAFAVRATQDYERDYPGLPNAALLFPPSPSDNVAGQPLIACGGIGTYSYPMF